MSVPPSNTSNFWRSSEFRNAVIEFVIVGGAALLAVFWIIPEQTFSGRNLALSASFLPTLCAAAIGLLALMRFLGTLLRLSPSPVEVRTSYLYPLLIMGATLLGIVAIRYLGWITGGAILALLISLSLGERRPVHLVLLTAGVALLLFLIGQTGI